MSAAPADPAEPAEPAEPAVITVTAAEPDNDVKETVRDGVTSPIQDKDSEELENHHSAYNWYAQPERVDFVHRQWYSPDHLNQALNTCSSIHSMNTDDLAAVHPTATVLETLVEYCKIYEKIGANCINTDAPARPSNCEKRVFFAKAFGENYNRTFISYFPPDVKPGHETQYPHVLTYYWCFAFDPNYYFSPSHVHWLWNEWRKPEKNTIAIHQCKRQKNILTLMNDNEKDTFWGWIMG